MAVGKPGVKESSKVALFDLDGTLVRFSHDLRGLRTRLDRLCAERGLPPLEGLILEGLAGLVDHVREREGDAAAGALQRQCAALCEAAERESVARATLLPGVAEALHRLRARGYRLGVVSRAHGTYVHPVIARLGLARHFEAVLSREMVKYYKPHPQALFVALERMGILERPDHYYMIGDHPMDMQAAIQAGATPVAVLTGEGNPRELSAVAEMVIPDVASLPEVLP